MATYLVTKCRKDGTTPLDQCPEVEIDVLGTGMVGYQNLLIDFHKKYHEWQMVSWGLKDEILTHRQRVNQGLL